MATKNTPWWKDDLFRYHFTRSTYITSFTDWFMTLAGKSTEFVLYATVLYSCAQLYPGVNLPDKLSLAVFLVQMGSLDIGGLSLAKMAKQAREDGNADGAKQAEILSHWLIGIMLTGVVTVGLGHVVAMPPLVSTIIQIVLVLARSIGSVLYGRVIHALKSEMSDPAQIVKSADIHVKLNAYEEQLRVQFDMLRTQFDTAFYTQFDTLQQTFDTHKREVVTVLNDSVKESVKGAQFYTPFDTFTPSACEDFGIDWLAVSSSSSSTYSQDFALIEYVPTLPALPTQPMPEKAAEKPAKPMEARKEDAQKAGKAGRKTTLHVVPEQSEAERVRRAYKDHGPDISDRKLANLARVSPPTAGKWREIIEQEKKIAQV